MTPAEARDNDRRTQELPPNAPLSHSSQARPVAAGPSGPLRGRFRPPGDKSVSHRALIFGLLAIGETAVDGLLEGEDVLRTAEACRALGAEVEREGPGRWRGRGAGVGGVGAAGAAPPFCQTRPGPPPV